MRVYMDNGATTKADERVVREMLPFFTEKYGNASSIHSFGSEAKEALEKARKQVAGLIGADASEIIFTAGGTESDNMAIRGIAHAHKGKGSHLITSNIEHPAVRETFKDLEKEGFKVTFLPVGKNGVLPTEKLREAITDDTILVSVMHANNEVGTIQPIKELAEIAHEKGAFFHTDAVQSVGKIPVNVKELGVDLLALSSHKLHGPKGVGALFVKNGVRITPIVTGGGHEKGLRSSTENIPGIVGLGKACELAEKEMKEDSARMLALREKLVNGLLNIPEAYLNGDREKRLPHNANFRFLGIEGESLILMLDDEGIAASTGSACSSKKLQASPVLLALGLKEEEAHGSLRLTLSKFTTDKEIERVLEATPKIVEKLRAMSPVWRKMQAKAMG